ncbi:uncharacterized protein [Linepithema humile]|uniref:uncharacterized protein isoform X2 n=1 Tax=Linepithema humile TaxID=83485 RepID=UPI00351DDC20
MKTGPVLQLVLIVMLLIGSSEEFFFQYPKKALTEFFQSLKAKQLPKTNVQHYHVHYYPIPFPMLAWRAPEKRDLEKLYNDHLRSLGWSDHHYKYMPEPSIIVSSGPHPLLDNIEPWDGIIEPWDSTWDENILGSDDIQSSIDRNMKGILVQVPVNQQLVFHLLKKRQRQVTT